MYLAYREAYIDSILKPLVGTNLEAPAGTPLSEQTRLQQGITVAASLETTHPLPLTTTFPRAQSVYWRQLDDAGFKFRKLYQPYECEVCLFGPLVAVEIPLLLSAIVDLKQRIKALDASEALADSQAVCQLKIELQGKESELRALNLKEARFKR